MHVRVLVTQSIRAAAALIYIVMSFGFGTLPRVQAQSLESVRLEDFDLTSASSGWILLGGRLFWTSDHGQTWEELGPALPANGTVRDVDFGDTEAGWVVWTEPNPDGSAAIHLEQTVDHGRTWTRVSLDLFEPGEVASYVDAIQMGWFDAQTGWLAVKQESGSNFSAGSLFRTIDGGESWERSTLPAADQIRFSDPQNGWALGDPSGATIFQTRDGGYSWQRRALAVQEQGQTLVYPPYVSSGQTLLVTATSGEMNSLTMYSLDVSSAQWQMTRTIELNEQPNIPGLSILDENSFVAVLPGTNSILRMAGGELEAVENKDGMSSSIAELDMISLDAGWAKWIDSSCHPGSNLCTYTTRLLHTQDGGATWSSLELPLVGSDKISVQYAGLEEQALEPAGTLSTTTQVLLGQGFDRCEIPTLTQMQAWANASPYQAVNLYIGGSSRACSNTALTSNYLFQLNQQGWRFIPTWVGPQAPCTGYLSRMSSNVDTAYNEGLIQANLAVDRLAALGLTDPDKTGSVVYYDIEPYGTNQVCRDAVNAFMNGWVAQLRSRGHLAGVYGSTLCNTALSDFLTITNVPDVVWPARWYSALGDGYYNPNANVWDLGSCIPNTAWPNHQRIRQYEGDHFETWGGVTLDIDSNAIDGVVAVPFDYPFVGRIVRNGISPTNASTVSFSVIFSKPVTGVNQTDFSLSTSGVSSASISSISGSGAAYTVTANTGSGNGTLRLDVVDNDSIIDSGGLPLGGLGTNNGTFRFGEVYSVDKSLFYDVRSSHWARVFIERLYNAGVTSGCSTSPLTYCPDMVVTRDQMAVFLLRAKHGDTYVPPAATGVFGDVPADSWAAKWIEQLAEEGITSGCGNGNYCPTQPVTRDQMAVFLLVAKHGTGLVPPEATGVFEDVPADSWAARWIEQLAEEGITSGCSTSPMLYCPTTPVTRDQMAVFLVETFNLP
jgi:photosystem II stability/assembly factor-like uncharacterized protein